MLRLERRLIDKREKAPAHLVSAVDLVKGCIESASRKLSNQQLAKMIERLFDENKRNLAHTIRYRVRDEAVDVFDGPSSDHNHAHVAINQANGKEYYWRNSGECRRKPSHWLR